jgi:hypothetical protein
MSDAVTIKNLPDAGSKEAVALRMAQYIWNAEANIQLRQFSRTEFLKLYVECLNATAGVAPRG